MFDCGSSKPGDALTVLEVKELLNVYTKSKTIFISHGDLDYYTYLPTVFNDKTKIDRVIIGGEPKSVVIQSLTLMRYKTGFVIWTLTTNFML